MEQRLRIVVVYAIVFFRYLIRVLRTIFIVALSWKLFTQVDNFSVFLATLGGQAAAK